MPGGRQALGLGPVIRTVTENCSVRLRHPGDDPLRASIFCGTRVNHDRLAGLQNGAVPTGPSQNARRTSFNGPLLRLAVLVLNDHEQPGVRVGPAPLRDRPCQHDDFIDLIGRIAVVGKRRKRRSKTKKTDKNSNHVHPLKLIPSGLSPMAGPFNSVPADAAQPSPWQGSRASVMVRKSVWNSVRINSTDGPRRRRS